MNILTWEPTCCTAWPSGLHSLMISPCSTRLEGPPGVNFIWVALSLLLYVPHLSWKVEGPVSCHWKSPVDLESLKDNISSPYSSFPYTGGRAYSVLPGWPRIFTLLRRYTSFSPWIALHALKQTPSSFISWNGQNKANKAGLIHRHKGRPLINTARPGVHAVCMCVPSPLMAATCPPARPHPLGHQ